MDSEEDDKQTQGGENPHENDLAFDRTLAGSTGMCRSERPARGSERTVAGKRFLTLQVVPCEGVILDRILESTYPVWHESLSRQAYRTFDAAQMKTAWASHHRRRYALVEGTELLASATQYNFDGVLDGRPVRVCGIATVFTEPAHRGAGHARTLINRLIDDAARDGADIALSFSEMRPGCDGWQAIPTTQVELSVAESARPGAPMTMVRGGEGRDLAAIAAIGQARAAPFRFHLDRDVDLVQYAITRKRLLAGLEVPGARQLLFFIAEEGITAAAYVVVSVVGHAWTIEECGDWDPSGARVGALLQALIAREATERRPSIRAWLPPGFVPPQVTIVSASPPKETMLVRLLGSNAARSRLSGDDVVYWRSDIF
jgi:GNAT superfamily N-acetyltransferase